MARWKKVKAEKLSQGKHVTTSYFKKIWKSVVLQNTQMKETVRKKEALFTSEIEKSINWCYLNVKAE